MARGELTGRKPANTADKSRRRSGPPINDPSETEIEATPHTDPKAIERRKAAPIRGPPFAGFTILEFCVAHRISRAQYYVLKARGLGPDETILLGRKIITNESAKAWRRRHTVRSTPAAQSTQAGT